MNKNKDLYKDKRYLYSQKPERSASKADKSSLCGEQYWPLLTASAADGGHYKVWRYVGTNPQSLISHMVSVNVKHHVCWN